MTKSQLSINNFNSFNIFEMHCTGTCILRLQKKTIFFFFLKQEKLRKINMSNLI